MLIVDDVLEQQYQDMKSTALRLKQRCTFAINRMLSASVEADTVINLYRFIGVAKGDLAAAALLPGIGDYAKAAEDNALYDLVAEITTVVTGCADSLDWVDVNFPSSNGYILVYSISDGVITPRTFSIAQTADFRTELQVIVDAIT